MKRFVVYLTTYTGTLLPPKYIGSTSEDKILSGNYFGSIGSKKWKSLFIHEIKNNKHLFSVSILSYHQTRKSAFAEELKLHILNNVVKSNEYFNESFADSSGYIVKSGVDSPNYGKKFSIEHRQKLSESHKGNIPSPETLIKLSKSHKGFKFTEESKEKIRNNQPRNKSVFQLDKNGTLLNEYPSIHEAYRQTGKSVSKISSCCNNHIKSAGGFIWKFNNLKNG